MNRKSFASFSAAMGVLAALTIVHPAAFAQTSPAQVTVQNVETQPVPVKAIRPPGTQPFQYQLTMQFLNGYATAWLQQNGQPSSLIVPAGKLLTIEYAGLEQHSCQNGSDILFG